MYPEGEAILVVDSDDARRGLVQRILTAEGFAVTIASEGLAGLREMARRRFALAVAAVELPGTLDGTTLVRQARARQPRLKALLIGDGGAPPPGHNPDSDDFITAPFQRRELLGCVFELLQREVLPGAADLARRCRAEAYAS